MPHPIRHWPDREELRHDADHVLVGERNPATGFKVWTKVRKPRS